MGAHLRQADADCVREMPPLSWTLRDSPRPAVSDDPAAAYSFGVRASLDGSPAAFQSALPPAVLLPVSFRGGCSFGAATLTDAKGATSPAGVHTAALCVAPQERAGQSLRARGARWRVTPRLRGSPRS